MFRITNRERLVSISNSTEAAAFAAALAAAASLRSSDKPWSVIDWFTRSLLSFCLVALSSASSRRNRRQLRHLLTRFFHLNTKIAKRALQLDFVTQCSKLAPRELELAFDATHLALAVFARLGLKFTENLPDHFVHDALTILNVPLDPLPPGLSHSGSGSSKGRRRC